MNQPRSMAQMPLRLPTSLHAALKAAAEREGVSLNQYCLYLLARYSGGDADLKREKGEGLLKFLEEAQVFQSELKKSSDLSKTIPPDETPRERWRKIYGKD